MNTELLREIGLTDSEIKAYLALLELGSATAGPIIEKSKVTSSKIYEILERLMQKGLVNFVIKSKTRYYDTQSPSRLKEYLQEKKRTIQEQEIEIEKLIPQLEIKRELAKNKNEASIHKGIKAIKNFYLNILDELNPGDEYFVLGANYGDHAMGIRSFFHKYHQQRADKKIKLNMLVNSDTRGTLVETTALNSEVCYLPPHLMSNMTTVFYKNKAFIFFLTSEPTGFLIESKEVVDGFRSYYDTFKKIAKK